MRRRASKIVSHGFGSHSIIKSTWSQPQPWARHTAGGQTSRLNVRKPEDTSLKMYDQAYVNTLKDEIEHYKRLYRNLLVETRYTVRKVGTDDR